MILGTKQGINIHAKILPKLESKVRSEELVVPQSGNTSIGAFILETSWIISSLKKNIP